MLGIFNWKTGTPTKYGGYLVLCEHNRKRVIHYDVWFDDGRRWQSKWHNMIAWCALEDIEFQTDYWTKLEHQYAGMAMQGILANYGVEPLPDDAANDAYNYAHALIEKMKESI